MKTSQSAYGNSDGSTLYYTWTSSPGQLTCAYLAANDLIQDVALGIKAFYEARGYTVTDCYNQKTNNIVSGAFSFALYKAEIDAGRPVMLHLNGHTVVGVGYSDAANTVYLHDTWDYGTHTMTWGGSYSGRAMMAVSIVKLLGPLPAVGELAVARVDDTTIELTWVAVTGATGYEVWYATGEPYFTPGDDCNNPGRFGCAAVTGTSFEHASLGSAAGNITYAVRAVSASGAPPSLSAGRVGEFVYDLAPGG